jgi:HAD superfamily hydrolase (TIGR01662 family)
LIFDLDYTLIDSSEGIVWCFNEARRRAGEPEVEPDKLKARIGLPIEDGFRLFGSRDPLSMRELFRKLAREGAMAERSFLLPGVAETLSALREKGYRLAVASTKSRPEIVAILKHLGVADSFAEFVGSDEVKDPKPAPDSLLLAMERLRAAPERTVYVGDHVVDVKAGRSAGVRVIAVLGGPCSEAEVREERPAAVLASIKDILPLFSGPGRDD